MQRRGTMALAAGFLISVIAWAGAQEGREPILDTSGFWRCHFTLAMPVFRTERGLEKLSDAFKADWAAIRADREAKWLEYPTAFPPAGWMRTDFDDGTWCRMPGTPAAKTWVRNNVFIFQKSPYIGLTCMRGRFTVSDPARTDGLTLSVEYRGGAVVYLNGKEIARGAMPAQGGIAPEAAANDYAEGEPGVRRLEVALPRELLRKGTNVLAIEIHASPYRPADIRFVKDWTKTFSLSGAHCALETVRLEAPAGAAVVANVGRPKGFQLWNSDVLTSDFDLDWGDPNEPLRPIRIVGARNGAFSGEVMVGSDQSIRSLRGVMSDMVSADGKGRIPASAAQVRYGWPGVLGSVQQSIDIVHHYGGTEAGADARYLADAGRFEDLLPTAPAEVPVRQKTAGAMNLKSPGISPSFGAVVPVWVTVNVPADAASGDYKGTLTITAEGVAPRPVPVSLRVEGWQLPDPKDFRTFADLVESPESVALWYDVPLWSDRHFQLLEKSLELIGRMGACTTYIPLICETNLGNAQTMVRWVKGPDGTYVQDYTIMDRYLDLVEEYQGKPMVVCIYVWDNFLPSTGRENWGTDAAKNYHGGPEVSVLDPATGEVSKLGLPLYTDPASEALWQPVLEEVKKRLAARGWENVMMLGTVSDRMPDAATAGFFKKLLPGVPWVSCSHNFPRDLFGIPFGYQSNAYDTSYVLDPSVARQHGWQRATLVEGAHFARLTQDIFPLVTFRLMGEMNIARNYRGFARVGADFWPALKDRRGRQVGMLAARYSKSSWWNLNLITSILAPGPDGAVATVRYEMLREGIQECEARIFIERALLDKDLRAKLGEPLAKRCQDVLDERTRDMLRGVSALIQSDRFRANRPNDWWQFPGVIGSQWFQCSDWQGRSEQLFAAAAEVAGALGRP